jgi:hypothetical protein
MGRTTGVNLFGSFRTWMDKNSWEMMDMGFCLALSYILNVMLSRAKQNVRSGASMRSDSSSSKKNKNSLVFIW